MHCDSCGIAATGEHLHRRTQRLELATRFRPIHIQVLLLALAPPLAMDDFFYNDNPGPAGRSAEAKPFTEAVLAAAGVPQDVKRGKDALAALQRAGWFVGYAVECPAEEWRGDSAASDAGIPARFAPSLILRVTRSYKPRWIVPIGGEMNVFVPALSASCGASLRLDDSHAFEPARLAAAGLALQ